MFYLTTHSTHFISGYMASDRQDNTYHRPLLYQLWSTGWNKKYLNGSTMKDRSDDPSHHDYHLYDLIH